MGHFWPNRVTFPISGPLSDISGPLWTFPGPLRKFWATLKWATLRIFRATLNFIRATPEIWDCPTWATLQISRPLLELWATLVGPPCRYPGGPPWKIPGQPKWATASDNPRLLWESRGHRNWATVCIECPGPIWKFLGLSSCARSSPMSPAFFL